jgi:hypothetical protein
MPDTTGLMLAVPPVLDGPTVIVGLVAVKTKSPVFAVTQT